MLDLTLNELKLTAKSAGLNGYKKTLSELESKMIKNKK